jgi:hypothetical protein
MLGNFYYVVAIIAAMLTVGGITMGLLIFLVRRNDKITKMEKKLQDIERELDVLRPLVNAIGKETSASLSSIGTHLEKVDTKLEGLTGAQNLIFRALSGVARKIDADDVVEMLEQNTVVMAKRK